MMEELETTLSRLAMENNDLKREVERLRKYVQHYKTCDALVCITNGPDHLDRSCSDMQKHPCNCGLEKR